MYVKNTPNFQKYAAPAFDYWFGFIFSPTKY